MLLYQHIEVTNIAFRNNSDILLNKTSIIIVNQSTPNLCRAKIK